MESIIQIILLVVVIAVLAAIIMPRPYLGIILTLVSLPIVDLLPEIPYLSSIVVLIGAVTLVGFLFQKKNEIGKPLINFNGVHLVGLLFLGWIFISNPQAAWFGKDRNWFITFLQLWILVWLAGELLDSPRKHHILMWLFSVVSAAAAISAIQQGRIRDTVGESFRAAGLAGNPNSTARYLVVAMVMFSYLGSTTNNRLLRLISYGGAIVTFLGLFFTLSRTGIILLIVAVGLQIVFNARRKRKYVLVFTYIIAAAILWYSSDSIIHIIKSILPSIQQGTDTIGLRYALWQAALRMWSEHIIQGIGIGRFSEMLRYYSSGLPSRYWTLGPHNTYIGLLAETGIVGLFLFILLLALSLWNFLPFRKPYSEENISLQQVWLTVFLVILIGETTFNGAHDKLLWIMMGISIYFQHRVSTQKSAIPLIKEATYYN